MLPCPVTSMAQEVVVLRRLGDNVLQVFGQQVAFLYQSMCRLSDTF
jgi:hypothetical protein